MLVSARPSDKPLTPKWPGRLALGLGACLALTGLAFTVSAAQTTDVDRDTLDRVPAVIGDPKLDESDASVQFELQRVIEAARSRLDEAADQGSRDAVNYLDHEARKIIEGLKRRAKEGSSRDQKHLDRLRDLIEDN